MILFRNAATWMDALCHTICELKIGRLLIGSDLHLYAYMNIHVNYDVSAPRSRKKIRK